MAARAVDLAMHAVTYYEELTSAGHRQEKELLKLWVANWTDAGFSVHIVGREHAERHAQFAEYDRLIQSFPTVNATDYEAACWRRWLAYDWFSQKNTGLNTFVDYDVFNVSFAGLPTRAWLHECRTAAFVDDGTLIRQFIATTLERGESGMDRRQGRLHVSDCTLASAQAWPPLNLQCVDHPASGPLIHVCNGPEERDKIAIWIQLHACQSKAARASSPAESTRRKPGPAG